MADPRPLSGSIAEAARSAVERSERLAERHTVRDEDARRVTCPECSDTGWIEVTSPDLGLPLGAKPCRHCRPVVYRRWREHHFAQGHVCAECAAIRGGRISSFDFDSEGNYTGPPLDAGGG